MVQAWKDNANLYRKFGVDKATPKKAGEYRTNGQEREVEIKLTLSELTETETIVDDTVMLPAGALLKGIEVLTITAAATGTAIDVGLIKQTDRSTEVDYNGILDAFVTASMNTVGEQVDYIAPGGIGAGTGGPLLGTVLAFNSHISASRTTATAFTAGDIRIRLTLMVP
jgi:hypothetical protein